MESIESRAQQRTVWREITALSIPNVVSNITVPLMGMADVAIAGHVGGDITIGATAIGTTIFNMIYKNCSFLRMGGSGVTAQAFGAGRFDECLLTGARSIGMALILSIMLLVFGAPIRDIAVGFMGGSAEIMYEAGVYVAARWWAIPASVSLFAVTGWFIGMQDSKTPMIMAILGNLVNIGTSAWLAIGLDMGIAGIAWGTVVAQWSTLALAAIIYMARYKKLMPKLEWKRVVEREPLKRLMTVNRDIFLRTFCLLIVFTSFTAFSARYGDVALAANSLMMQIFTFFSYLIDGLAFAGESITGRFVGAKDSERLKKSIDCLTIAGLATAIVFTIAFAIWWHGIFSLFGTSDAALEYAGEHIGWGIAVPLVCFYAFVADGIMVGATRSKAMRDTMAAATVMFFVVYFGLRNYMEVNALWLAFLTYMAARGGLLAFIVAEIRNGGKKGEKEKSI